ncbi:ribosomal protein S12 [Asimina triloba]
MLVADLRTAAVNAASGSAYAEFGNTKVIVSVHAPPVSAFPKAPLSFKRIHGMSSPGKGLELHQ